MSPVHFIPPGPLYSLNHSHHHCGWDPFGCHSNFASHPETFQTSGSEDPLPDLHYHCTAVREPSSVTASPTTSLWRMATTELLSNACALLLTHSYGFGVSCVLWAFPWNWPDAVCPFLHAHFPEPFNPFLYHLPPQFCSLGIGHCFLMPLGAMLGMT